MSSREPIKACWMNGVPRPLRSSFPSDSPLRYTTFSPEEAVRTTHRMAKERVERAKKDSALLRSEVIESFEMSSSSLMLRFARGLSLLYWIEGVTVEWCVQPSDAARISFGDPLEPSYEFSGIAHDGVEYRWTWRPSEALTTHIGRPIRGVSANTHWAFFQADGLGEMLVSVMELQPVRQRVLNWGPL